MFATWHHPSAYCIDINNRLFVTCGAAVHSRNRLFWNFKRTGGPGSEMAETYPISSRSESERLVKNWGFRHVFTWSDGRYFPHLVSLSMLERHCDKIPTNETTAMLITLHIHTEVWRPILSAGVLWRSHTRKTMQLYIVARSKRRHLALALEWMYQLGSFTRYGLVKKGVNMWLENRNLYMSL